MRFMIMLRASAESESGKMPSVELMTAMGKFNEELVNAGVLLAGEGLHPSASGARVRFEGSKRSVIEGPFAEPRELVAGFWLFQVKSKEEAIEWVKRCPNPFEGAGVAEIDIRRVYEMEDFADIATPELVAQEEALRARI